MTNLINSLQNNGLAALAGRATDNVLNAIEAASTKTGVNFAYLMQQANAESSFNADAKAKTSSATGLYQFIERTWLDMVNRHGDKHGIDTAGKSRSEILEMRKDPEKASLMAAELASENERFLKAHTNADIGSTELYFAHFLGAGKAAAFINARAENPLQKAAHIFPKAAKANYNVFYDRNTGEAKTLDEVYARFDGKFSDSAFTPDITPSAPTSATENTPKPTVPTTPAGLHYAKYNGRDSSLWASGLSSYQGHITNPVEIMLLAQLELPIDSSPIESRLEKRLHQRSSSYNQ